MCLHFRCNMLRLGIFFMRRAGLKNYNEYTDRYENDRLIILVSADPNARYMIKPMDFERSSDAVN